MKNTSTPVIFFILLTGLLVALILATPYLAFHKNQFAGKLYDNFFSYLCHQKISRSLCLFDTGAGYVIGDCTPQNGIYREDTRAEKSVIQNEMLGYKFPVSARDMFIYIGMFSGAMALLAAGKANSRIVPPAIFLIAAIAPIAIDGITQTIFGIRESTNMLRIITGTLAGLGVGIYAPLIMNKIFIKEEKHEKA